MKKPYIILDEISILIGAGIDGRGGMAAVFDGLPMESPVTPLKLTNVQQFSSGAVWLRYAVKWMEEWKMIHWGWKGSRNGSFCGCNGLSVDWYCTGIRKWTWCGRRCSHLWSTERIPVCCQQSGSRVENLWSSSEINRWNLEENGTIWIRWLFILRSRGRNFVEKSGILQRIGKFGVPWKMHRQQAKYGWLAFLISR